MTEQQKGQLLELLTVFEAVTDGRLGRTSACQHHIHTKDGPPVRQQLYRLPHVYKEAVEKEIELMLRQRIIEPASSGRASPIVIIKKKDDTIHLCVDYRRLNAMTQVDAYPMPREDDVLDQVSQPDILPLSTWLKDTDRYLLQKKTVLKQLSSPLEDCINSK